MSSDPLLPPDSTPPTGSPVPPLTNSSLVTTTGLPPNLAAGLSMLLLLLGGIIFVIVEKRNQFVRFWAMQSILYGAAWVVFEIAAGIIGLVLNHIPLINHLWSLVFWLAYLGFLIGWISLIVLAFIGSNQEIPVLGKIARQQLAKMPTL